MKQFMMLLVTFALCFVVACVICAKCPNGGQIYAIGISQAGKNDVVAAHNSNRLKIARGEVAGQPRGVNLKRMVYDDALEQKGRVVSNTCEMKHILAKDNRWSWVGQNLYLERSSQYTTNQNWAGAVAAWFNEYKDYQYPKGSKNGKQTGHYTQVVWANSKFLGCDFILFYDSSQPRYPYSKLYTCNYGPGGNYNNEAPYKTGNSGCENLC